MGSAYTRSIVASVVMTGLVLGWRAIPRRS